MSNFWLGFKEGGYQYFDELKDIKMKVVSLKFALLVLAASACYVTSSLTSELPLDIAQAKALVSKTANTIIETKALEVERVLSALSSRKRNLQSLGDLDTALSPECLGKVEAVNATVIAGGTPTEADLNEIVECVTQSVIDSFDVCLGSYPGFWNPIHCSIIASLQTTLDDPDLITADSENGASVEASTGSEYEYETEENPIVGNKGNLALGRKLNRAECIETFGTGEVLKPLACMFGININDVNRFIAESKTNFTGNQACIAFAADNQELIDSSDAADSSNDPDALDQQTLERFFLNSAKTVLFQCDDDHNLGIEDALEGEFNFNIPNPNSAPVKAAMNSFNVLLGMVTLCLMIIH